MSTQKDPFAGVIWHDVEEFGVRGLAWTDEDREQPYDRFPSSLKEHINDVLWRLSTRSAGLFVDYQGAPSNLYVRWTHIDGLENDPAMSGLSTSGLDTYGRDALGAWRWLGRKLPWQDPNCDGALNQGELDGQQRIYRTYFPLQRRVGKMEIGSREPLEPVADIERDPRPIAYYGTSIVHGAGVGRSGMAHAAQLGRLLEREIYNLGFCGHAWLEPVVAEALARIDAPLYILDPIPNNTPEQLGERLPKFLQTLRAAKPKTPILLVEDRQFGGAAFVKERSETRRRGNTVLHQVVKSARATCLENIQIAGGIDWFGEDGEGTVDGSHPNDLGAYRMARSLKPFVEKSLENEGVY